MGQIALVLRSFAMHTWMKMASTLIAFVLCTATDKARAWNDQGHMMIACIAYRELPEKTRQKLIETLKGNPTLYGMLTEGLAEDLSPADRDLYVFMRAATWADMIRDEKAPLRSEHRSTWHYVNLPISRDGQGPKAPPPLEWHKGENALNIVQALIKNEGDLKDADLDASKKAIALAWMLHLGGDIHQPLHAVALYSNRYAKGDEGGNRIFVKDDTRTVKLHAFWDGLLGNSKKPEDGKRAAERLVKEPGMSRADLKAAIKETGYAAWAKESKTLAEKVGYGGGKFPPANADATEAKPLDLPPGYRRDAREVAERQIVLAGYRLADTLARMKN